MNLNTFMANSAVAHEPPAVPEQKPAAVRPAEKHIPEGQRNSTLSHLAGKLILRYGNTQEAGKIFLEKAKACDPPLPLNELRSIWRSAVKFGQTVSAHESYIPPEQYSDPTCCKPDDYTDVGQAYAFSKQCRDFVRYSPATDYIVYDGICWRESKPRSQKAMQQFTDAQLAEADLWLQQIEARLTSTGASALLEQRGKKAEDYMTPEQKAAYAAYQDAQAYRKFVLQRRDSKYQMATLREARPMVEIDYRELDKDGFLLNTPAYTVDLRLGMEGKRDHRAEDFLTKCTAVTPGEEGAALWEEGVMAFFSEDEQMIAYVQRIAGLAIIGHVYIEALIIAHGDGKNGKSTFWNVLSRVLGDYSGSISADALTVGCKRNVKPELAETKGKRLLIAAELEEGMRLNTSVVKQFCSTDEILAEKKYKDPFTFTPTHTLVLYTNHLPKVGANDPGTWRRPFVVPITAHMQGSGDIKNYADYLFENAGPAILAWMIEGARLVIAEHFHIQQPNSVQAATEQYRLNSDWLEGFLDECCEIDESYSASSGELYTAYRAYCARTGEYARTRIDFCAAIDLAGFTREKTRKGRFVNGLRLRSDLPFPHV